MSDRTPSDDRPAKRILSDFNEQVELLGYTAYQLVAGIIFVAVPLALAPLFLSPLHGLVLGAATIAVIGILFSATPKNTSPWGWAFQKAVARVQQSHIRHDKSPDWGADERLAQPPATGLLERTARRVGLSTTVRTQDAVPLTKPYAGSHAIERRDGALIGFIRVTPANMSTADPDEWEQQVKRYSDILVSAVDFPVEQYDTMHAVDYEDIYERWASRERDLRRSRTSDDAADADGVPDLGTAVLADICEERAGVINLYDQTTFSREHYLVVTVEPDAAADMGAEDGGLASVPGIGRLFTRTQTRQHTDAERTRILEGKLEQRVNRLARSLRGLDDIKAYPLQSGEASKVIADYYWGVDAYSQADFAALVRGAPLPADEDSGDPEYALDHATTVAVDGADREAHYRSLIAPNELDRSSPDHLEIDDTVAAATIAVRDWPSIPTDGMFSSVLAAPDPGVSVTMATHYEPADAGADMERTKASLEQKWKDAEERGSFRAGKHKRDYLAAKDITDTLNASDRALFDAGTYLSVRAPDEQALDEAVDDVLSTLQETPANARGARIINNHLSAFQTTAPVGADLLGQRQKMRDDGLAATFPWATHNLSEAGGIEVGTHQDREEPTVVDFFNRQTGYNFGVFGDIGSGKTTTLGKILLHMKATRPELNIAVIDPLEEFANLCEVFGGERIVVGGETAINPLHIEETPAETLSVIGRKTPLKNAHRRAMTFVETYYRIERIPFEGKRGVWQQAIKQAYADRGFTHDPATHAQDEKPTLTDVIEQIESMAANPEPSVREALRNDPDTLAERKETAIEILNNDIGAFEDGGKYEHLTRQTDIDLRNEDFVYLDLHLFEAESQSGLMMQLLVNQLYEQVKASPHPGVIAIDESHYMFKHASNLGFFKQIIRHSRHHDLSVGFSTQTVSEFFADAGDEESGLTDNAEVILNNMSMQVFHYLSEMDAEWADELDLTTAEMQYIQEAEPGNEQLGYSEGLLHVDKEGCFPIKVEMDNERNPKEFTVLKYDPGKHGEDFAAYLRDNNDVCDWGWV